MIKIENVQICGWEPTIRGMRNPLNSWAKSDSKTKLESWHDTTGGYFEVGPNDKDLMERLAKGGPCHAKYRRFITVYLDILAPLYWWKEFETYKVGTDSNSCSTMHKIADKEFTLDDFSHEHLMNYDNSNFWEEDDEDSCFIELNIGKQRRVVLPENLMSEIMIPLLNTAREKYIKTKTKPMKSEEARKKLLKKYWWQMIQLLPSSYNQRRTIKLNYETLYRIYHDRKGHKLDEWNEFCSWIESLPLSEVITGPSLKDIPICNEIMEEAMRRIVDKFARENILSEEELKKILGIKSPSGKDEGHLTKCDKKE